MEIHPTLLANDVNLLHIAAIHISPSMNMGNAARKRVYPTASWHVRFTAIGVSRTFRLNPWNNYIPGDDKPISKDTPSCFWNPNKAWSCTDRVVGDGCVKEWREGVAQLANIQVCSTFYYGLIWSKHTLRERCSSRMLSLSLPLKSSLILSEAEQCLTGAHNHFMTQA